MEKNLFKSKKFPVNQVYEARKEMFGYEALFVRH